LITEDKAIKLLGNQIKEINEIRKGYARSSIHTIWITDTLYILEEIFGRKSRIYISFNFLRWDIQPGQAFFVDLHQSNQIIAKLRHQGFLDDLETAIGIIQSGINLIKRRGISNVYEGKDTPKESSEIIKIISLIENKLRKVMHHKPTNEKEIQDTLENLFIGASLDNDFTREKERFPYSSKGYIPDFVFSQINTIVEVKFCDSDSKLKEIISEINDDIIAYKTKYENMIFVIYDLGIVRDQDEFKLAIEKNEHVIIKIIKH
jgi:DpnII restriction endonuclease